MYLATFIFGVKGPKDFVSPTFLRFYLHIESFALALLSHEIVRYQTFLLFLDIIFSYRIKDKNTLLGEGENSSGG